MPGMGGRELYERILQQRPKIKVLYMSGYTDNGIVRRGVLDPGTPFLQKPFSPISLARKVKEVLETRE
jgi:CheY-like chemotaxis protein